MSSREAKIKLIAEGAGRARSEVNSVSDSVKNLGSVGSVAQKALSEIGKAAFHAASDAARAMNDVKPIDFGSAADKAKSFEDVVTRLALRTGGNSDAMRQKFRGLGEDLGVSAQRVANFTKNLTDQTGALNAGEAVQALGKYANDTGRTLEDLGDTGRSLYSDFGVSLEQIGGALQKVRGIALDFSHVGGPVALENSLVRLAPLLARFEGGSLERRAALLATFGRGKSARVAEETTASILGAFGGSNTMLVEQTMREIRKDPRYSAYTTDQTGQTVMKPGVLRELQQYFKSRSPRAVQQFFGTTMQGLQAAQTFVDADLSQVDRAEQRAEALRKFLKESGALPIDQLTPSQLEGIAPMLPGFDRKKTGFASTRAGQRARTDVERENVELSVGDTIQEQRDKRNALYEGRRGTQAAVDTARSYLPSKYERILDIGEAAGVEAKTEVDARRGTPTVELGAASIDRMAQAVRSSPIIARPEGSPAATAVEANKARNRASGSN